MTVLNNSTFFSQSGSNFFVKKHLDEVIHPRLPGGNYAIKFSPEIGFFLEKIADFPVPRRVYGEAVRNKERIYNSFKQKQGNLGVVLFGEKGSGKTMLGREISRLAATEGVPTLFVTQDWAGDKFFQFLYSIQQECIIFIDEYEKLYEPKEQEKMLTVLDGVFQSKKMFVLTCNDRWKLDQHIRNRPGRIHYLIEFNGLGPEFVQQFCEDSLDDKTRIQEVVSVCSLFSAINFDMLQALVWEMNLYKESAGDAIKLLNAKPESDDTYTYNISLQLAVNRQLKVTDFHPVAFRGSPLKSEEKRFIVYVKSNELTVEQWNNLKNTGEFDGDNLNKDNFLNDLAGLEDSDSTGNSTASANSYESNDDYDRAQLIINFSVSDIVSVDPKAGTYVFKDKYGNIATFTREKPKHMSVADITGLLS